MKRMFGLLLFLHLIVGGASAQAQFDYVTNSDGVSLTLTGYSGAGGAVTIPASINGLPITSIGTNAFAENGLGLFVGQNDAVTSVTIPEGVTNIGNEAFLLCPYLTNVSLPASLRTIGSSAFLQSGLTEIILPDRVTSLGQVVFAACASLTNVVIGTGVKSIGTRTFEFCSRLARVTLPDGLTNIGALAFLGCADLDRITIPGGVTSIGVNAFEGCTNLTKITVEAWSSSFRSVAGVLFDRSEKTLIQYPEGLGGSYAIPDTVTRIGAGAFSFSPFLTTVSIPRSVTNTLIQPFGGCGRLTAITVDAQNLNYKSADGVLFDKAGRTLIQYPPGLGGAYTIPAGVTNIGRDAFYGSSGLEEVVIPGSVVSIGTNAFGGCASLTNIAIGQGVKSIGPSAFYDCSNLTSVVIPGSVTNIRGGAFSGCAGLTNVTISGAIRLIPAEAFQGCSRLANVTIPESVTNIGDYAFSSCSNLTAVRLPAALVAIGAWAFSGCGSLTGIVLPPGVTVIPEGAFQECAGLTNVTIPDGVTNIGDYAFNGCAGLTSVLLPPGVTTIAEALFWGCTSMTNVTIPDGVTNIGGFAFLGCTSLASVLLPPGITTIPDSLFSGCTGMTSLAVPAGVTNIGDFAFSGCTNLTDLTLPGGVAAIGQWAFTGCAALTSLAIPQGVTDIGESAFFGCTGLTNLTFPNGISTIAEGLCSDCVGLSSVVIPAGVTSIGNEAFSGCISLTNLTFPSGISSIAAGLCSGCTSLTSVTIPEGVTNIGDEAFYSCLNLTNVTIPASVTQIGNYVFIGCTQLTGVHFQGNEPAVGNGAFFADPAVSYYLVGATGWGPTFAGRVTVAQFPYTYTTNGGTVTLLNYTGPGGDVSIPAMINGWPVTGIGADCFESCASLTNVTIPASVTNIGAEAFSFCTNLIAISVAADNSFYSSANGVLFDKSQSTLMQCPGGLWGSCTIPDGVTSIGNNAFNGCEFLTDLVLPSSVTNLGNDALGSCPRLGKVYFEGNAPAADSTVFGSDTNVTITYYVGNSGWGTNFAGLPAVAVNPFYYTLNADNTITITGYIGTFGDLTIPSAINGFPVSSIADAAFQQSGLTQVTISDGIASIGINAFEFSTSLTRVSIPASVTNIGTGAFTGEISLTEIAVDAQNPFFSSVNGVLFDKSQTTLLVYPGGLGGSYTVPDDVTNVADSAFIYCTSLGSVTLNTNITIIRDSTFAFCFNLTNVTIPDSAVCIGAGAFQLCALSTVTIPNSVTNIGAEAFREGGLSSLNIPGSVITVGDGAFEYCYGLTNVTMAAGLTSIGDSAFSMTGLTGVTIPEGVTRIGPDAFDDCPSLASATIPGSATNIGADAFVFCPSLTNVTIGYGVTGLSDYMFYASALGSVLIPASVTSIGDGAFQFCGSLTNVTIPDGVANIGIGAFENCGSLANVTLPGDLASLGDNAFNGCGSLRSVTIPDGVPNIGVGAFEACGSLAAVSIGDGVTNVGDSAFYGCTSLTSVTLPRSVINLDVTAFENCSSLAAINVDSRNPVYSSRNGVLFDKSGTTLIEFPGGFRGSYTIPNGVTSIGDNAFYTCVGLTSVAIPASVTNIGNDAFASCGLTSVTIPTTVASVGTDGFANCLYLSSATLPGGPTIFWDGTFSSCSSLSNVTIANGLTSIASDMFYACASLSTITLPASVTSIGDAAFSYCSGLKNVYFLGNAPAAGRLSLFWYDNYNPAIHYLPGTAGWSSTYTYLPTIPQTASTPQITTGPLGQTVLPGGTVTLQVAGFGPAPLNYQWRFNGNKLVEGWEISGVTSNVLTVRNATPGTAGSYTVVVSNPYGAVTSPVATVSLLAITAQPANRASSPAGVVTFSVAATGAPLTYQWLFDGAPLSDDENISGSSRNRLTINFASSNNAGSYAAVVACPAGVITSRVALLHVSIETNHPTVAITSPRVGSRTAAPVLSGTAWDPVRVQSVAYWISNVNNGVQTTFNGLAALTTGRAAVSNWVIQTTLLPGTNILAVQSSNYAGLASPVASATFFYEVATPLQLLVSPAGAGAVTGIGVNQRATVVTNGSALNVGESYTLTAKPAANWWFTNWLANGALAGTNASFSFIMESNLMVTAEFVTNLFVGKAARYDGIFYLDSPPGVTEGTAGLIGNLRVSPAGVYSGKLYLGGTNYALAGAFNHAGDAVETIGRNAAAGGNLTLRLNIPWQSVPRQITGSLQGTNFGGWISSNFYLWAATTNTNNFPAYTAVLPQNNLNYPGSPPGYGYMLVANSGSIIKVGGRLADGTPFSCSEPIDEQNQFPVYASLYHGQGLLLGELILGLGDLGNMPLGGLAWVKPRLQGALYTNGFTTLVVTEFRAGFFLGPTNAGTITLTDQYLPEQ